jgi:hypothetical protein
LDAVSVPGNRRQSSKKLIKPKSTTASFAGIVPVGSRSGRSWSGLPRNQVAQGQQLVYPGDDTGDDRALFVSVAGLRQNGPSTKFASRRRIVLPTRAGFVSFGQPHPPNEIQQSDSAQAWTEPGIAVNWVSFAHPKRVRFGQIAVRRSPYRTRLVRISTRPALAFHSGLFAFAPCRGRPDGHGPSAAKASCNTSSGRARDVPPDPRSMHSPPRRTIAGMTAVTRILEQIQRGDSHAADQFRKPLMRYPRTNGSLSQVVAN